MSSLLAVFIVLQVIKNSIETALVVVNQRFYRDEKSQREACSRLGFSKEHMAKTVSYTDAKVFYNLVSSWTSMLITLVFIICGGLGWAENIALQLTSNKILVGLSFFGILGVLSMVLGLPFEYYFNFKIEERFGFNKQSKASWCLDKLKQLILGTVLGGVLLGIVLYLMANLTNWWLYAWGFLVLVSIISNWLYPVLFAPLFNKFTLLQTGELRDEVFALAKKLDFATSGIYLMDASKRSTHGNAFFAGLFGKKRIILYDTLLTDLSTKEIVATLAHELGHFKLNHIRNLLFRAITLNGLIFFLFFMCQTYAPIYDAFYLSGVSFYGGLVLFSMWIDLLGFVGTPMSSWLSRRNEFAADLFAHTLGYKEHLLTALLKLQESNYSMPISHPWYSAFFHSHPLVLQRIEALEAQGSRP